GRYYDPLGSTNSVDLSAERLALSPLGVGRLTTAKTLSLANTLTGAQLLASLDAIRAPLQAVLDPGNRDFAVRNLNFTKQAASLIDPDFQTPYADHLAFGAQHQFGGAVVVGADVVRRSFRHAFISGADYNRFESADGPVIPKCTAGAQAADLAAV